MSNVIDTRNHIWPTSPAPNASNASNRSNGGKQEQRLEYMTGPSVQSPADVADVTRSDPDRLPGKTDGRELQQLDPHAKPVGMAGQLGAGTHLGTGPGQRSSSPADGPTENQYADLRGQGQGQYPNANQELLPQSVLSLLDNHPEHRRMNTEQQAPQSQPGMSTQQRGPQPQPQPGMNTQQQGPQPGMNAQQQGVQQSGPMQTVRAVTQHQVIETRPLNNTEQQQLQQQQQHPVGGTAHGQVVGGHVPEQLLRTQSREPPMSFVRDQPLGPKSPDLPLGTPHIDAPLVAQNRGPVAQGAALHPQQHQSSYQPSQPLLGATQPLPQQSPQPMQPLPQQAVLAAPNAQPFAPFDENRLNQPVASSSNIPPQPTIADNLQQRAVNPEEPLDSSAVSSQPAVTNQPELVQPTATPPLSLHTQPMGQTVYDLELGPEGGANEDPEHQRKLRIFEDAAKHAADRHKMNEERHRQEEGRLKKEEKEHKKLEKKHIKEEQKIEKEQKKLQEQREKLQQEIAKQQAELEKHDADIEKQKEELEKVRRLRAEEQQLKDDARLRRQQHRALKEGERSTASRRTSSSGGGVLESIKAAVGMDK